MPVSPVIAVQCYCFNFRNYFLTNPLSTVAFTRTSSVKMVPIEVVDVDAVTTIAQSSTMLASASGDFGGYFYPIAGIGLLGALILYLSPPLADE